MMDAKCLKSIVDEHNMIKIINRGQSVKTPIVIRCKLYLSSFLFMGDTSVRVHIHTESPKLPPHF